MKKAFVSFLVFLLAGGISFASANEEFYIVTQGPVAVGGGMIRHYFDRAYGRVSTRYSYGGVENNVILVEKQTRSLRTGFSMNETLRIPFAQPLKKKRAWLEVGSHTMLLTVNKRGRVIVREVKGRELVRNGPNSNIR